MLKMVLCISNEAMGVQHLFSSAKRKWLHKYLES